jgi:hypothetical protein
VRRGRRVLSATAWAAAGFALAVAQGLFGSKLYGLAQEFAGWWRDRWHGAGLWWSAFVTWQGASREQREQMRRDGEDRFDLWDNDLRSEQ